MIIWLSKRQFAIDFQRIGIFTGISIGFGTLRKLENTNRANNFDGRFSAKNA